MELINYYWTLRWVCSDPSDIHFLGEETRKYSNDTVIPSDVAGRLLKLPRCFLSVRVALDLFLLLAGMVSKDFGSQPSYERGVFHGYSGTLDTVNFREWDSR